MLNQLFHGTTNFAWAVRTSGFVTLGMLVVAGCLMKTRLPPKVSGFTPDIKSILTDVPFMLVLVGYVSLHLICSTEASSHNYAL